MPIAIVTGCAQGIGKAIALRLADDGYDIGLNDVVGQKDEIEKLEQEILKKGRLSRIILADVSNEEQVKNMVDEVVKELGGLDVMIANAGIHHAGGSLLIEHSAEDFDRVQAVNVRGTFLCYKYAALVMISQGRGGRIIGACSGLGKRGLMRAIAYSASKFAIRGLTQTAAIELAEHGITVNAYAPGVIETPMTSRIIKSARENPPETHSVLQQLAASGKVGEPEDVAGLVSYLVSKEGKFITGQSINIDGGWFFD
ncbi:hypothetical protein C8J56DRAFT_945627 [Mycena floridula]|nr:hypothetical protein C8J56DRAFT_945627 [Mycena floridula]